MNPWIFRLLWIIAVLIIMAVVVIVVLGNYAYEDASTHVSHAEAGK